MLGYFTVDIGHTCRTWEVARPVPGDWPGPVMAADEQLTYRHTDLTADVLLSDVASLAETGEQR